MSYRLILITAFIVLFPALSEAQPTFKLSFNFNPPVNPLGNGLELDVCNDQICSAIRGTIPLKCLPEIFSGNSSPAIGHCIVEGATRQNGPDPAMRLLGTPGYIRLHEGTFASPPIYFPSAQGPYEVVFKYLVTPGPTGFVLTQQ